MKKLIAMLLTLSLLLCSAATLAMGEEASAGIACDIEDGCYVIRIPDEKGWIVRV